MRRVKLIFLIFVCCLTTGCWDKMEIEDRNYVITMGVDRYGNEENTRKINDNDNNRYTVSLGMAGLEKTSGGEKGGENENTSELLTGQSLSSVMKLADMYSSKQVYYGQTKAVVFGEELLKDKALFKEALDSMERNQEINMKVIVLAGKGRAADSISAVLNEKSPSGLYIWDFYKNNSKNTSSTEKKDLEELLISLRDSGNAVIPLVEVENNKIRFGGGAIIKDYELCGYITDTQERGILWIEGRAEGGVVDGIYNDITIPMYIVENKSKISFYEKNGNIICNIDIKIDGSIESYKIEEKSLLDSQRIDDIEKVYEKIINDEITNTIDLTQKEYNVDVMDLLGLMNKKNNELYLKNSDNLDKTFSEMNINVNTHVSIRSIGVIK